jgi:hypothetical protein
MKRANKGEICITIMCTVIFAAKTFYHQNKRKHITENISVVMNVCQIFIMMKFQKMKTFYVLNYNHLGGNMNTINLLITSVVIPDDTNSRTKSEKAYNDSFLPVDSFKTVFPIDDCIPEI